MIFDGLVQNCGKYNVLVMKIPQFSTLPCYKLQYVEILTRYDLVEDR